MVIKVEIKNADLKRLNKRLTDRAAVRAYNVATFAAQAMEEEVVDIVEYYFVNDRPPSRRKTNQTKLINSFRGFVRGTRGELPVDAVLGLKPGANEKKVAALEHGSSPHIIQGDPWLAWPRDVTEEGTLENLPARSRIRNAIGTGPRSFFATRNPVYHPGNAAYGFMAQARQRVRHMIRDR